MDMNTNIEKLIEKCSDLVNRSEKAHKNVDKIKDKIYDLICNLDMHGSAIEMETVEDINSSIYHIIHSVEDIFHAAKRISELCKLGKCDRFMITRIKMAVCEMCAAEKQIEVLKEMLKIK